MVGFWEAVKRGFGQYCCFTGRASRSEYWWFNLFVSVIAILVSGPEIIDVVKEPDMSMTAMYHGTGFLSWIWYLAVLLPSWGLLFRRLHDTGRSGWWVLINLIPLVGSIVIFVFTVLPSQPFTNKYGPVPNLA